MKAHPHILLVDDELFFAKPFIDSLRGRFQVTFTDNVRDALKLITASTEFEVLVLDVMMPTPEGVAESTTSGGLNTGLWLLDQVAPRIKSGNLAVVLLTNRVPSQIMDDVQHVGISERRVRIVSKSQVPPSALAGLIDELIQEKG
jgi:CheY-like chemotaxis protein